tara:strand:- start:801 stop:1190 length:390 start_codon:yes stop_codon:yes gene_type:complete
MIHPLVRKKILLVEANKDSEALTKSLLETQFANELQICSANAIQEAIDFLKSSKIDFVVSAFVFSDGNGIEIYNYICESKQSIKLVFYTGHLVFEFPTQEKFFYGFLQKPDTQSLIDFIEQVWLAKSER